MRRVISVSWSQAELFEISVDEGTKQNFRGIKDNCWNGANHFSFSRWHFIHVQENYLSTTKRCLFLIDFANGISPPSVLRTAKDRFQWYQFAWRPPQRSESSPVRIVEQRSDPKQVESGNKASKPSTGAWLLCARAKAIKTQTQSHKSYFCLYALSHTETCIHMRGATKFARFSTGLH